MFAVLGVPGGDALVDEINLCETALRRYGRLWAFPWREKQPVPAVLELRRRRDELLESLGRARNVRPLETPVLDPATIALLPGTDWVVVGASVAAVVVLAAVAYTGRGRLAGLLNDFSDTVRSLLLRGAEQMRGILATMRRDRQFEVVPPGTLMRERESLGRMVGDYTGDAELAAKVAASGDCSAIMPDYEKAMSHPITSAVAGPLTRLLLIQVQKAKCDAAMGLSAVDKLVSANEINFQIISATPIVVLFYGTAALLYGVLTGRNPLAPHRKQFRAQMAALLRMRVDAENGIVMTPLREGRYLLRCANAYRDCRKMGTGRKRAQRTCLRMATANSLRIAEAILQAHELESVGEA